MTTQIRIRAQEGCENVPHLYWDSIWVDRFNAGGGFADWILAGDADQADSRGGLRSEAALHTATMLILFTDSRAADTDVLPDDTGHRRGWWGDSIKLDGEPEGETGSLIWLDVERGVLNDAVVRSVKDRAEIALAVLADQGAVARTVVETGADPARGMLTLVVRHFDAAGGQIYDQKFQVLWDQAATAPQMNFGDEGVFA